MSIGVGSLLHYCLPWSPPLLSPSLPGVTTALTPPRKGPLRIDFSPVPSPMRCRLSTSDDKTFACLPERFRIRLFPVVYTTFFLAKKLLNREGLFLPFRRRCCVAVLPLPSLFGFEIAPCQSKAPFRFAVFHKPSKFVWPKKSSPRALECAPPAISFLFSFSAVVSSVGTSDTV